MHREGLLVGLMPIRALARVWLLTPIYILGVLPTRMGSTPKS